MVNITPILGCDYIRSNGQIDEKAGVFGILEENFRKVKTGNIVPAFNNTRCACRKTRFCSVECKSAVSGFMVGGKISFRNIGKRM